MATLQWGAKGAHPLTDVRYGHYRAALWEPRSYTMGWPAQTYSGTGAMGSGLEYCVTLLWPNHTWLVQHGWGTSEDACTKEFDAERWEDRDYAGGKPTSLMLFDSYFPQLRLLGKRSRVRGSASYSANCTAAPGRPSNNASSLDSTRNEPSWHALYQINNQNAAHLNANFWKSTFFVFFENTTHLNAPMNLSWMTNDDHEADSYVGPAIGRYGLTLDSRNSSNLVTHQEDGCTLPCPRNGNTPEDASPCSSKCAVLQVGSATVAAIPHMSATKLATIGAIKKLLAYANMSEARPLPWCTGLASGWWGTFGLTAAERAGLAPGDCQHSLFKSPHDPPISIGIPHAAAGLLMTDINRSSELSKATAQRLVDSSVSQNCCLWDSLGVGFVNTTSSTQNAPSASPPPPPQAGGARSSSPSSVADGWRPFLFYTRPWDDDVNVARPDICFNNTKARVQIVADAARLLEQQVAQELATTDATRTKMGAFFDLSVMIVGVVALASGLDNIEVWCTGAVRWCARGAARARRALCVALPRARPVWGLDVVAGRLMTCAIVIVTLVLPQIFIVIGEDKAWENNAKGDKSNAGWLSVSVGNNDDGCQRVVVAAVAVRLFAQYDEAARVMVYVNLGIASVAAICICVLVWLPDLGRVERQELRRQLAFRWRGSMRVEQAGDCDAGRGEAKTADV